MKKDILSSRVIDLIKSADQNLSDFEKGRHSESLHQLRVDLKKIKAAYSFAEFAYKDTYTTAPLKSLFKDAGNIREIQVNVSLMKEFPYPPKRLITRLEHRERNLTEAFINDLSSYSNSLKDFRKHMLLPKKEIESKTVLKYFAKMREVRFQKNDADEMHSYRIRIKRMMHIYYMLPDKMQQKTNLDIESIEKLQHELGDWHDLHTAIEYLSGETVPKRVAEHILKLRQEESNLYETLRNKLIAIPDH